MMQARWVRGRIMEVTAFTQFGKDHDASNWFSIAFSLVAWPMVLAISAYYWSRHKVRGIPHFDVQPTQGQTAIGGQPYNAVNLTFTNLTGSIVYIRLARLREQRSNFPIPPAAIKSIGGWRELKFLDENRNFTRDQVILETGGRAVSSIAVSRPLGNDFDNHTPGWLRMLFRRPKYFVIQYTAMVSEKKYSVAETY
jgi:hypothetical protein